MDKDQELLEEAYESITNSTRLARTNSLEEIVRFLTNNKIETGSPLADSYKWEIDSFLQNSH